MKPIEQTIFVPPDGNCFAASIASILEMPLDLVPNFMANDSWYEDFQSFLAPLNLQLVTWMTPNVGTVLQGYSLCQVVSFAGPWRHTVVAKDMNIVWDPNPANRERKPSEYEIEGWSIFCCIDPSKNTRKVEVAPRALYGPYV